MDGPCRACLTLKQTQGILQRTSYSNTQEAEVVLYIVRSLFDADVPPAEVCVITLYAAQRVQLQGRVPHGVQVDTVDAYQGRECDYVIISLVRSNTKHSIGHGGDPRRMNVALTRARRGLVVIGDISTFAEPLSHRPLH